MTRLFTLLLFVGASFGAEELVELKREGVTLHGTLDLPQEKGPFPVVIIHAGSGPTDRDGNQIGLKTDGLKMLGQALAQEKIACLRIDKRGVGKSVSKDMKESDITIAGYINDILAWTEFLKKDPRFSRVAFIGHSEGATLGVKAAKKADWYAFVSLCGTGRPLHELLKEQLDAQLRDDWKERNNAILQQLASGKKVPDVPKELNFLYRESVQQYLIDSFQIDPAKEIATLTMPILIVGGGSDLQVKQTDYKLLCQANPKAQGVWIEEMGHTLKKTKGKTNLEQLDVYTDPKHPLHEKLVPTLVDFLKTPLRQGK